jgi:hypothetical protein
MITWRLSHLTRSTPTSLIPIQSIVNVEALRLLVEA